MIRIIAGVILIIGNIGSIFTQPPYIHFSNLAHAAGEIVGYIMAKLLIFIAAVWLIHSGSKKRKIANKPL